MPNTRTAAMQAHFDSGNTTLALCAKVKWTNGSIFAWTEHDRALPDIDLDAMGYPDGDGPVTYKADDGVTRASFQDRNQMRVSSIDVAGAMSATGIQIADIYGTRWDKAIVTMFFANWQDTSPTMGIEPVKLGYIDKIVIEEQGFSATIRDLTDLFNTTHWTYISTKKCRNILGDYTRQFRCGVQLDPPGWTALQDVSARVRRDARAAANFNPPRVGINTTKPTVFNGFHYEAANDGQTGAAEPSWNTTVGGTTPDGSVTWNTILARTLEDVFADVVADRANFTLTGYSGPAPDQFYRGTCTAITGQNAGISRETKSWINGPVQSPPFAITVELLEAMPYDIAVGDEFTFQTYCSKFAVGPEGCVERFDNTYNRAAEDLSPTDDKVFALR